MKVLVVDDSKVARNILKKELVTLGCEVVGEAANGKEGFNAYLELKPELVFSDIEMPEVDGYKMLDMIKKANPSAKVAFVSSVVNSQILQKLLALGAMDIMKKPINSKMVEKVLNKAKLL